MKARTKYKQSVINIYNSGKVMFQGKCVKAQQLLPDHTTTSKNSSSSNQSSGETLAYNHYNCIEVMKQEVETTSVL